MKPPKGRKQRSRIRMASRDRCESESNEEKRKPRSFLSFSRIQLTGVSEQSVHRPQRREHGGLALCVGVLGARLGAPGLTALEVGRELAPGVEERRRH